MFKADKDPQADLDYGIDWSAWLAEGETIATSTWTVQTGSGLTTHDASTDGTVTSVWLSGGLAPFAPWGVTNHIVTTDGRTDDRTIFVRVAQR